MIKTMTVKLLRLPSPPPPLPTNPTNPTNPTKQTRNQKKKNSGKEWIGYANNFITAVGGGVGKNNNSSTIFDYLAMQVLYELDSNKPLYGMFPPTFRAIWLSWNDKIQNEKNRQQYNAKERNTKKNKTN